MSRNVTLLLCFTVLLLISPVMGWAQSRDIRKATEEELNRDITETEEERQKRRLKVTKKGAMEHYWNGNFRAALEDFLVLLGRDPADVDVNFHIGACYLETHLDKLQAIPYLEYVVQQPKFDKEAIYQLGRAYMFAHRFDEAIITFNKYKDIARGKDDNIITGARMIEMCFNAKQLVKYPRDVIFENLGSLVNSPYPDYNPFIPEDESFIVFTSKRPDNLGMQLDYDGFKTPDVYLSRTSRGQFREARNIGSSVNTEWYEEVVGVSADGTELLVYIDNYDGYDDIYVSPRKGRFFDEYYDLGRSVNTDDIETTASMSSDGKLLFFTREPEKNPKFGTDIYMSRKLPNGRWSEGVRLPDIINTRYNESFPHLASDGKTFYFASEGHTSMGGFDIFVSEYDDLTGTFSVPKNLGYPINTVDDNFNVSMSTTGRYGYTAQFIPGQGFGELDIYRVTFKDVAPVFTIVRGSITNIRDSLAADPNYQVGSFVMTVTDMNTDAYIGTYRPNQRSSNYAQLLEPGEYCVYVEGELFFDTMAVVEVLGRDAQISELIVDYTLRPDPEAIARAGKGCQTYAITASDDRTARVWELPVGRQALKLEEGAAVTAVAVSPDGTRAVTARADGKISLWGMPDGNKRGTHPAHRGRINSVVYLLDGNRVLTAGTDSTVRLINPSTGAVEKEYSAHLGKVNSVSLMPDGKYFVSGADDGLSILWEISTGDPVGMFQGHDGPVLAVACSPVGNTIATAGKDGTVRIYDGYTAKEIRSFGLHTSAVRAVAFSPDGSSVVSGSDNGFTYVWNPKDASVRHVLLGDEKPVTSVAMANRTEFLVTSSTALSPQVYKWRSGSEDGTLMGHSKQVNDVALACIKFPEVQKAPLRGPEPIAIDDLEEEILRLEAELAAMEQKKLLGYDQSLLEPAVAGKKDLKVGQKIILERIYFDFDKYNIRDESVVELNNLLYFLNSNPNVIVEISGHTDSRGTDEYNETLSMNRAKSVVAWLKQRDIASKRMVAKGYGETRHIAPNENPDGSDNPDGRQMNRRIELTIIGMRGEKIITTEGR